MLKTPSLKAYILFWITLLALAMSTLLTYQSTQYFLEGFDSIQEWQMIQAADLLPEGQTVTETDFGYHVSSSWEQVPDRIRAIFPEPPQRHYEVQIHFENWWYFAPPETSYSLLSAYDQNDELRYISKIITTVSADKPPHEGLDPMVIIALWGLGSLVAFIVITYKILSNLARPIQSLYGWAKELDLNNAKQSPPDFTYQELNQLALIIQQSVDNLGRSLEKEKEFLGFASHELRTPIATLRSNATLLDKISPSPTPKEREVRDRILRASLTMKGITETLLWLNRDNQEVIETSPVNVEETIIQIVQELEYLLSGKQIELSIQTMPCSKPLPEAAFRILLTNIIRNAFQHTTRGTIEVVQDAHRVQVINTLPGKQPKTNTGFGLGLKLTRKIVERFNWHLEEQQQHSTMDMTVTFDIDQRL